MRVDGTERRTVFDKGSESPFPVALDQQLASVYFVDPEKYTLNVVDLEGQNHKVLLTNLMYLERANDLDVFEDRVYFCDPESESILSVDKFHPESSLKVLVKDAENVLSCRVLHFSKQRSTTANLCDQSECEFLCLPRSDIRSYSCVCPANTSLALDKLACRAKIEKGTLVQEKFFLDIHLILLALAFFCFGIVFYICRGKKNSKQNEAISSVSINGSGV